MSESLRVMKKCKREESKKSYQLSELSTKLQQAKLYYQIGESNILVEQ